MTGEHCRSCRPGLNLRDDMTSGGWGPYLAITGDLSLVTCGTFSWPRTCPAEHGWAADARLAQEAQNNLIWMACALILNDNQHRPDRLRARRGGLRREQ